MRDIRHHDCRVDQLEGQTCPYLDIESEDIGEMQGFETHSAFFVLDFVRYSIWQAIGLHHGRRDLVDQSVLIHPCLSRGALQVSAWWVDVPIYPMRSTNG